MRIALLGNLCKIGQEGKDKMWNHFLQEFCQEAKIALMFNSSESLATLIVDFLNKTKKIFNDLVFYEKICIKFKKLELDYVSNWAS